MVDTYADDARKELNEIWEITEALTNRDPYRPLTKVVAKGFTAITYALLHVADVIEEQTGELADPPMTRLDDLPPTLLDELRVRRPELESIGSPSVKDEVRTWAREQAAYPAQQPNWWTRRKIRRLGIPLEKVDGKWVIP